MTDDIRPVSPVDRRADARRSGERRMRDRRAENRALTTTEAAADPEETAGRPAGAAAPPRPETHTGAEFAAQILGQPGRKRGLKGGAPVLNAARSAYLGREYSGAHDRRPRTGSADDSEV